MALYAIGDLHLSLTADKPMEVFGPAWENYTERIGDALSRLTAGDVLVLAAGKLSLMTRRTQPKNAKGSRAP